MSTNPHSKPLAPLSVRTAFQPTSAPPLPPGCRTDRASSAHPRHTAGAPFQVAAPRIRARQPAAPGAQAPRRRSPATAGAGGQRVPEQPPGACRWVGRDPPHAWSTEHVATAGAGRRPMCMTQPSAPARLSSCLPSLFSPCVSEGGSQPCTRGSALALPPGMAALPHTRWRGCLALTPSPPPTTRALPNALAASPQALCASLAPGPPPPRRSPRPLQLPPSRSKRGRTRGRCRGLRPAWRT